MSALAVATGVGETLATMLSAAAAGGGTGSSTWIFSIGNGVVAAVASSISARDLLAEAPEPLDWDREV